MTEEFFDFYNHPTLTVEEIVKKRYTQADLPKDINEKLLEAEIEMNTNSKRYTIEEVQIALNKIIEEQ